MKKLIITTVAIAFSLSAFSQVTKLSIDKLNWLTGQRLGQHDGGFLEQVWLPPRSGTITALVRSSKESRTRFVEIIHVREINGSLELNLQIFNDSLEPAGISSTHSRIHKFELTDIGDRYALFQGVSDGAHRRLSYQLSDENIFIIRFETNVGEKVMVRLKSTLLKES
tara:strand:- start:133 stop:636 length:504 start_codon:yes stop_codon:yes gene_type:complete